MSSQVEVKEGYIRADADVRLLDSATEAAPEQPGGGYLDLLTDDGRLRLKVSFHSVEGLIIDLQQLLAATTSFACVGDARH